MLKTKKLKAVLAFLVIFSMVAIYGYSPAVKAASLESLKDTVSNSDFGETATHVIILDMTDANPLSGGEYVKVNFAAEFTTISNTNATCPAGTTEGGSGQDIIHNTSQQKEVSTMRKQKL